MEALRGERSGIDDPFANVADLPYQDVQPHQAAIITTAAGFVGDVPASGVTGRRR
jgi:hypothetical protein